VLFSPALEFTMRRRQALIIEDDVVVMGLLKMFLSLRGYDFSAYREPITCPIYKDDEPCNFKHYCADIMLIDFNMPGMDGTKLIKAQSARQCKLTPKNKAIISGYSDIFNRSEMEELGCAVFEKPIDFTLLAAWFDECEQRMDLTMPLGTIRMEKRRPCSFVISFQTEPPSGIKQGVATNCSPSGLCLKIAEPLWLHQMLNIRFDETHPRRLASVRWTKALGDNSFMTGLHLMEIAP
jgi:CheY-like chemotaxis protein